MAGRTIAFGHDVNDFIWRIPRASARRFEEFVAQATRERLATRDGSIKVAQTPNSGDEGRDVEITYSSPIALGDRILTPASAGGAIYLECKATEGDRLSDDFLSDASQHEPGRLDAYVLATNATLTPYSHFRAERAWERVGAEFILLDRGRLFFWLFDGRSPDEVGRGIWPAGVPLKPRDTPVRVELRSRHERLRGDHRVQSYLVVRNNSDTSQKVSFSTASDLSWESDAELETILAPGEDTTYRLESRQVVYGLDAELGLTFSHDQRSVRLRLSSPQADIVLEPPFIGERHRQCRDRLRDIVASADGFVLINVEGEAGIGKSRTIDEALAPLEGGRADIVRLTCDPDTGAFDFTPLANLSTSPGASDSGPGPVLTGLVEAVAYASEGSLPLVLTLEDLHHCSPDGIRAIKSLAVDPPSVAQPVAVIVAGRNDHTFPNADYYAFLELVRLQSASIPLIELAQLSDLEARDLINSVAVDLPEAAQARVHCIGQNNPFVILEALQFLLDVGLAQLLSKRTIGVADPALFVGLEGLPATVEELYRRRLESLELAEEGQVAGDLLALMALVGGSIDIEVIEEFFGECDATSVLSLLRRRRFLKFRPEQGRAAFVHENLLHATRSWTRTRLEARQAAARLLERPVAARLSAFQRAEFQAIAQQHASAFEGFAPIWRRVQVVTNFSSEEIDRSYYPHLPTLFEVASKHCVAADELGRLAVAMGYMGVHNFPLLEGQRACLRGLGWLERVYPGAERGRLYKLALRQLNAHALQNMGRSGEALREMLELQTEIELSGIDEPTIEYDLFDRLQEHYRRANHAALMNDYGQLAARAVRRADDDRLLSSHLITQSLAVMYHGKAGALKAANAALDFAIDVGVRRFIVFNRLTVLIVKALYANGTTDVLKAIYDEARELLRHAAMESYSDSIIRLELLLATLALQVHDDPDEGQRVALSYIRAGREAAVRFGIGLYDWALENLRAVVELKSKRRTDEFTRRAFEACLERLNGRGLLFVGSCDGTFPSVHAISNVVRFIATYSEKDATNFVSRRLSSYGPLGSENDARALEIVVAALAGKALFWPRRLRMFRYPATDGYFTPLY